MHRWLPLATALLAAGTESLDLSSYDTVLSSSVLFSKGIIVRPGTRHISYCYSPPRLLWDRAASYERRGPVSAFVRHAWRAWDASAAQRPDQLVAISRAVADRIAVYWRRTALVIPPPTPEPVVLREPYDAGYPYLLAVGRLVPHKNFGLLIDACNKTRHRLVIAGDGPLRAPLMRKAGPTVSFAGAVDDATLTSLYAGATAVVIANDEDWGLTAVEAMMVGTPVLALRSGGVLETVIDGVSGVFFDDPIPEALADGIIRIRASASSFDRDAIRRHAKQWSTEQWASRMRTLVQALD
jgi:glycosyltransferase involved in cell wall biosynthesis